MKQEDLIKDEFVVPVAPDILTTDNGTWAMCPNCYRHLVEKYNEDQDVWFLPLTCPVCGKRILDIQKEYR